ncbi:MFS-type transporter SLC18B1 [Nymphon striatum]|nr:MFS-type transporter SLC18B1 [Nymphon striatum]
MLGKFCRWVHPALLSAEIIPIDLEMFMDRVNSTETFVGVSIVLRILTGIGFTFYKGSIYNTFIERFPNMISTLMGYTAASYGVGISIGPFIGGVLYDFGGFGLPLFVTSGVIGSLFIAMLILFPKIDFPYHTRTRPLLSKGLPSTPPVLSTGSSFHPIPFALTSTLAGAMFLGFEVVYAISCPIVGTVIDRTVNITAMRKYFC